MGYWSDEREDLNETIRMINQGAIRKAQENAELKDCLLYTSDAADE